MLAWSRKRVLPISQTNQALFGIITATIGIQTKGLIHDIDTTWCNKLSSQAPETFSHQIAIQYLSVLDTSVIVVPAVRSDHQRVEVVL